MNRNVLLVRATSPECLSPHTSLLEKQKSKEQRKRGDNSKKSVFLCAETKTIRYLCKGFSKKRFHALTP
ncbi:MAG: hypothetical protein IJ767_00960 [Bacteroidaceae bacterium]|nr:hypothetical protein [Bacteroidaceae bacterium]